ncbi:MAG: bifunctional 3-deoxy-7-phosphoheptulonate synthase/chorismate mutase type II [Bacteroidia bacterium]|nr:bifunctional 3-deoxy-7-phosphoheptulonate synthase/chorismate mutase type II [Bacteroidia bacterium]
MLNKWADNPDGLLVVAGPCGAESPEQLLQTARGIAATGKVQFLRAGIWKPRTRPDSFEGMGEVALKWLKEAGEETGLKTTVEVANARHTEAALKAGIDALWIGARTTVNPFYVQEIANALMGSGIPVMVKNPVNPEVGLWMGAIERMAKAGSEKLIAIHRGFSNYSPSKFRNNPHWEIVIELKRRMTGIPVICDVSHIAGNRLYLKEIAQRALDLDMQGLMVETHIHPSQALSDAEQQITPAELHLLLNELIIRKPNSNDVIFKSTLEDLRRQIDRVDYELIQILAARKSIVDKIGEYKRDNYVTVLQLERWEQILKDRIPFGIHHGLDGDFVHRLYELIHNESLRLQNAILNERKPAEGLNNE